MGDIKKISYIFKQCLFIGVLKYNINAILIIIINIYYSQLLKYIL